MGLEDLLYSIGGHARTVHKVLHHPQVQEYTKWTFDVLATEDLAKHRDALLSNSLDVQRVTPRSADGYNLCYMALLDNALADTYHETYRGPMRAFKALDVEDRVVSLVTFGFQILGSATGVGEIPAFLASGYADMIFELVPKAFGVIYWGLATKDWQAIPHFLAAEVKSMILPYAGDVLDMLNLYTVYSQEKFHDAAVTRYLEYVKNEERKHGRPRDGAIDITASQESPVPSQNPATLSHESSAPSHEPPPPSPISSQSGPLGLAVKRRE